jgi:hypothetical protein
MTHARAARRRAPADRLGLQQDDARPELGTPPRSRAPGQAAPDDGQVHDVGQRPRTPIRLRRELRLPQRAALDGSEWVGGP